MAMEIGIFDSDLSQAESSHPILRSDQHQGRSPPLTHSSPFSADPNPIYLLHNNLDKKFIPEALDLMGVPKHLRLKFSDHIEGPLILADNIFTIQWQRSIHNQDMIPKTDRDVSDSLLNSTLYLKECLASEHSPQESESAFEEGFCDSCLPMMNNVLRNNFVPPFKALQLLRKRMLRNLQIKREGESEGRSGEEIKIPIGRVNDFDVHQFTTTSVTNKPRNLLLYARREKGKRSVENDEAIIKASECILKNQPSSSLFVDLIGSNVSLYIHTGSESLVDQMESFNRALTVFGPHGSSFNNEIWSLPGTSIVEFHLLFPTDSFAQEMAVAMDQMFWTVPSLESHHDGTYTLNKQNLEDAINTIFTALFYSIRHAELSHDPSFDQRILRDPSLFFQFMRSRPVNMQLWPFNSLHSCIQEAQKSLPSL